MESNYTQPVNLGNPVERTIEEFAEIIRDLVGGKSKILQMPAVEDDPQRRKPDITRAKTYLNWEPRVRSIIDLLLIILHTDNFLFYRSLSKLVLKRLSSISEKSWEGQIIQIEIYLFPEIDWLRHFVVFIVFFLIKQLNFLVLLILFSNIS